MQFCIGSLILLRFNEQIENISTRVFPPKNKSSDICKRDVKKCEKLEFSEPQIGEIRNGARVWQGKRSESSIRVENQLTFLPIRILFREKTK